MNLQKGTFKYAHILIRDYQVKLVPNLNDHLNFNRLRKNIIHRPNYAMNSNRRLSIVKET